MNIEDNQSDDEIYATLVQVDQEPIELYKVLKIGNLVFGGGEAKQVISEGYVSLNGELETRKRKKVYAGDLVGFDGEYLQVALKGELSEYEFVDQETRPQEAEPNQSPHSSKKRKPISF